MQIPDPRMAIAAVLTVLPIACTYANPQQPAPPPLATRASVGFGFLGGAVIGEDETGSDPDFEGGSFGGRLDLSAPLDLDARLFEVGIRTSLTAASVEPETLPAGASVEVDVLQFAIAPLARFWLTRPDEQIRPYLEAFLGVHHSDVDTTASAGGLTATSSDSDSGLFGGAGFGVGIRAAENARVILGFEWTHSRFDDLEVLANAYQAHIGARFEF